jgi:hypothetical protein
MDVAVAGPAQHRKRHVLEGEADPRDESAPAVRRGHRERIHVPRRADRVGQKGIRVRVAADDLVEDDPVAGDQGDVRRVPDRKARAVGHPGLLDAIPGLVQGLLG